MKMFCKNCGKEVESTWNKCPYCGYELEDGNSEIEQLNEGNNSDESKQTKSKKMHTRIMEIISICVLIIIIYNIKSCIMPKLRGDTNPDGLYQLTTEDVDVSMNLSDYPNGFAGWKESGFDVSVKTDITIPYPIDDIDKNNYAVYIGTGKVNVGIIMQEDESAMSEWDWLMQAEPDTDLQAYYVSCELTYTGQNVGEDEIPVFVISDVESYANAITVPDTEESGTVVTNNTNIDYGNIYNDVFNTVVSEVQEKGGEIEYLYYSLYDIDKDGILELLIQNGTCDADVVYEIYTTDGFSVQELGQIGGDVGLYECTDGNGFYTAYGQMGYEIVNYEYIQNGCLEEENVFEGENNYDSADGIVFDELKIPITNYIVSEGFVW